MKEIKKEAELQKLTVAILQDLCVHLGLSKAGKKDALVRKVWEAISANNNINNKK